MTAATWMVLSHAEAVASAAKTRRLGAVTKEYL